MYQTAICTTHPLTLTRQVISFCKSPFVGEEKPGIGLGGILKFNQLNVNIAYS